MTDRLDAKGLPGLLGTEHIGLTVPDMNAAINFFVEVRSAEVLFEVGPFSSDEDWMETHLGMHPRAQIPRLCMLQLGEGRSLDLFEYVSPD